MSSVKASKIRRWRAYRHHKRRQQQHRLDRQGIQESTLSSSSITTATILAALHRTAMLKSLLVVCILLGSCNLVAAFVSPSPLSCANQVSNPHTFHSKSDSRLFVRDKLTKERRQKPGVADDEDEYDLGRALNANTDPLISKIIAGSFILVMITLLVVGVVLPSITDYGEGVCNPIVTKGRC
jgi:hypothetical protein